MKFAVGDLRSVAGPLDHPECVNPGPSGELYAGGEAGQIYRLSDGGEATEVASTGGFILGLCCDAAAAIYACDWGSPPGTGGAIQRIDPDGRVDTYCSSVEGTPIACPNYCVFDPDGWLWVSDSGTGNLTNNDGRLFRVPPGGGDGVRIDVRAMACPNGLALAPDGTLFLVESFLPGVLTLRNGVLHEYVKLPGTLPDGLALAADGTLYISCWQPNRIYTVSASARSPELIFEDVLGHWALTPTNLAFFGSPPTRLAIASLGGMEVQSLPAGVLGQPLNFPTVPWP